MLADGVLLDIDGVLTLSDRALPGGRATLAWLRRNEVPFLLATNTTAVSRPRLVRQLRDAGLQVGVEEVVTAPVLTAAYLRANHPGARCYLLATGDVERDFEGVDLVDGEADVVVIGGAEDRFSYQNVNRAFRMVYGGAALVAMHRNLFWMTAEGIKLDAGAYVKGLEAAAGVQATVIGKPSGNFFRQALELLGIAAERAAMVGDDLVADVLAAQRAGCTGVLVRTGKFRPADLAGEERPDHLIDSIAELPDLLAGEQ